MNQAGLSYYLAIGDVETDTMAEDFYTFVDSGDPAPDNRHITGESSAAGAGAEGEMAAYATRIAIYDDMYSTPRVVVIEPGPVRAYLEEITNTVYRCMKEQGGNIALMVIREIVENFIHAHFVEPIISILDGGNTIRFADQGPGIEDKERAFEFGVTSANRDMKRYIRGTGAGFPMVQQYLETAGGAVSVEDNLGAGTVVTVTIDPARTQEVAGHAQRGAAVRGGEAASTPAPAMPSASAMPQAAPIDQTAPYGTWPPVYQQPGMNAWQAPAAGQAAYPQPAYPVANPSYPQAGHQFSTVPQFPAQQGYPWAGPMMSQTAQSYPQQTPYISERAGLALHLLMERGEAGPTDLAHAYGHSGPTWSRELATLSEQGFIAKRGQKYHLTELGTTWIQAHEQ